MSATIIITLCVLLLIAYVFDMSAAKTRIPSVVLLLLLGWICKQFSAFIGLKLPDLEPALPVLGTIGLILIVLEGSLELELKREKRKVILQSFILSLIPMLVLAVFLTMALAYYGWDNHRQNLVNILPLCIISSAIAIPTARSLQAATREFVTYESSFSDIIGVLIFNFLALNHTFTFSTWLNFFLQIFIILIISLIATGILATMLNRIQHHIRYMPILLLVILIYGVCKVYHLPGLIFILLFGLFLGNLKEVGRLKFMNRFNLETLNVQVNSLHHILVEGAFLVRSLFFILFGFLINTAEVLNVDSLSWSLGITVGIYIIRALLLYVMQLPIKPLLFIAPRGLITILLYLSIAPEDNLVIINNSVIIQVIILSALVMMLGLIRYGNKPSAWVELEKEKGNREDSLL